MLLVEFHHVRQIHPAPGRDEFLSVHCRLHRVEVIFFYFQIGEHRSVYLLVLRVLPPGAKIRLHIDSLQAVQRRQVELPHGVVVFRRISGGDNYPAVGNGVASEYLVLQKLQHGRRQCLRYAVDFIQEEDALRLSRFFHHVVQADNDFTHGVFRGSILPAAVFLVRNERQTQSTLPGVMAHGIGHHRDVHFLRYLIHDIRLSDSRRTHEKNRPLPLHRNPVFPELVL